MKSRVVLLGWGNALPSQLAAYARLYKTLGYESASAISDTMVGLVRRSVYRRAVAGIAAQMMAEERAVIVHLFSDNGFLAYDALLETLDGSEAGRRATKQIRGVIMDSAPGLWNVRGPVDFARRFALAMTPTLSRKTRLGAREHVPVLTEALGALFLGYQAIFRRQAQRMIASGQRIADAQPRCPQLNMYGEADTVVPPRDVRAWIAAQRTRGIEIEDEPFSSAPHVALFPKDPRRYRKLVTSFAARVLALTVLVLCAVGCRHKKLDPVSMREPAAAAGADVDDPDALVEDGKRYEVHTWPLVLARYDVTIEDVGMTTALDRVLERTGAELVVNGGFFDTETRPLGLAISNGAVLSKAAPSMSGGVVTFDGERAQLWESETFALPDQTRFAVQCRPRLVVSRAPNVKRDDGQRSERTALCLTDGGKTMSIVLAKDGESGPSLYALGRYLARRGCEGALNLDGGPSTGAAWRENGTTKQLPPRRPVRQAIVFKPR